MNVMECAKRFVIIKKAVTVESVVYFVSQRLSAGY